MVFRLGAGARGSFQPELTRPRSCGVESCGEGGRRGRSLPYGCIGAEVGKKFPLTPSPSRCHA